LFRMENSMDHGLIQASPRLLRAWVDTAANISSAKLAECT
jgi:hypothetical protein